MSGKQIVIDSSVALKWRLRDEEATQQADALLDDFLLGRLGLLVPSLFDYEIVNALKVAVTRNRLSEDEAVSAISDFQGFRIERNSFHEIQIATYQLAYRYQRSAYDAAYLALAQSRQIWFYTGDKRLVNAVGQILAWVKWI